MIKRSFTVKQKLKLLSLLETTTPAEVALKNNIHISCIYRWIPQKSKFEAERNKKSRKLNCGKKPFLSLECERGIAAWISDRNAKNLNVLYCHVKKYCLETFGDSICKFTTGWFKRFKDRFGFSRRRVTGYSHRPQNETTDIAEKISQFREEVNSSSRSVILNMDETAVFFDMPMNYTITKKGTSHVKQRATSNSKKRITATLCCGSDGTKLPPTVVLKQNYNGPIPEGINVMYQEKAWMTSVLMQKWISLYGNTLSGSHLLLDSFSGHKTQAALNDLRQLNCQYSFIPPTATGECQPLDVGVNKPFKDKLRQKWNEWIGQGHLTPKGNYKSAPTELLLQWIKQAWDEISPQTILNSFSRALGVSN